MNRNTTRFALPCLVALFLGALYFRTLSPGLTWANDGADGGDLITAAATGGVPHPTGYPTYLAIASVFLKIPIGSLAFRTNLLSLICAVFAALVVYGIVTASGGSVFSAFLASLAFGTFPLIWSQAIITEVNALNALFCALIIFFLVARAPNSIADLAGGIALGLGIGNHVTSAFLLPLLFVNELKHPSVIKGGFWTQSLPYAKAFARRILGLCLGLSIYGILPFRARSQSPVNWGDAVDPGGFLWLVTGQMYRSRLDHLGGNYLWSGFQIWGNFLLEQAGVVGLALIFVVLAILYKSSRLYLVTAWIVLVYSAFSIIYYSPDSYVYLVPVLIALSIWMGLAGGWLVENIKWKKSFFKPLASFCFLLLFVLRAIFMIPHMDLSTDRTAEQYARAALDSAPPNAIIITTGDEATFSLWYFHYAYHQRSDVAVVCSDLLSQPWYHRVLKYTYPGLIVPDTLSPQGVILANAQRPICQAGPNLDQRIECSR